MNILGIDTSCDDTSAAVVAGGEKVLSNIVNSQVTLHHPFGGVVPELASREHLRNLVPVVQEALTGAGLEMGALGGIAVTIGPGLVGALLVGLSYAKALAYVHRIPLVGINHLEGHILSIFLEREVPPFPFVALTVSGGHTSLYEVKGVGDYILLGQTLDDAAGEAFDKVAKILGLGYPGGPVIEKAAQHGDEAAINFPRAHLAPDSLDFSFSGLKTAVSLFVKAWRDSAEVELTGTLPPPHQYLVFERTVPSAIVKAEFEKDVIEDMLSLTGQLKRWVEISRSSEKPVDVERWEALSYFGLADVVFTQNEEKRRRLDELKRELSEIESLLQEEER